MVKNISTMLKTRSKLQRELTDVLTRFRHAPEGDISEMFLQVGFQEKDRQYNRFLWRKFDTTKDPDI